MSQAGHGLPETLPATDSARRWARISDLLSDALEQPADRRADFLAEACGGDEAVRSEVESLLAAHAEAGDFAPPPSSGPVRALEHLTLEPAHPTDPERVGPYHIDRRLGEGGMGTVYRATRADREFEKQVAVKIIRADLIDRERVRRFRSERQILARLEHPNVARLLDGGTTDDGRPYLVMEYVEGRPIDRYCSDEALSLDRRLELFRKICAAVHVAHQNLVVHRDLKPANILVGDDGEPKLLDFGIAKLLQPQGTAQTLVATLPGASPMTLSHASPEQVRGQAITTASDVYALGVVLFQLLTGRLPYAADADRGLRQMAEAICDQPPARPSRVAAAGDPRWRRRLTGDLDMITLAALRKEPQERYASAEALANDLERYRKHLPVLAQGDTWRYRSKMFIRRNRLAVSATLLIAALTVGFIATLLLQQQQIRQEQRSAQEVARLMVDLFDHADPDRALGERLTARELLERGTRSMSGRLVDEPEVRATLLETLGEVHRKLGLLAESQPLLQEALEVRRQTHGASHPQVGESLRQLALRDYLAGDYTGATERYLEALSILATRPGEPLALTLHGLALAQHSEGELAAAATTFGRALDVARTSLGVEHPVVARILRGRANLEQEQGELDDARQSIEQALAIYRKAHSERHPDVAGTLRSLALVLAEQQEFEQADTYFHQALERQRQLYEGPHPNLATTLDNLANSLVERGRFAEAEPMANEALEIHRQVYGETNSHVARSINLLGLIRGMEGRTDEAEQLFRQAVAMWRQLRGDDHHEIASGLGNLGELLVRTDRLQEGTDLLLEALEISREVYGANHLRVAHLATQLGIARKNQGDLPGAEALYRQALPVLEKALGPRHARVAALHQNLGVVLRYAGRLDEAEAAFRQALQTFRELHGERHYLVAVTLKNLATVQQSQGRLAEAEASVRQALAIYAEVFPEDHPWVARA
ncbi:MAG: serine/threonine-protein kinase, partial [Acidobacteriota bacterium]